MKPAPFDYHAPRTLDGALARLAEYGDEARPLAGGQSLVPAMNFRLAQPAVLIDLNQIAELAQIRLTDEGGLRVGAMVRQRTLEQHPAVGARAPLVAETLPFVAHPQIRNRGTIGGSLAHADPAAELPAVAVTRGMRFHLRGPAGTRALPATDFYLALFETALEPGELLVEVEIPPLPPRTGVAFDEVARRHGDYAMAGAAAQLTVDEAGRVADCRLVFLSVESRPRRVAEVAALVGERPEAERIDEVARAVAASLQVEGDIHASAAYRRHLAERLARRVLRRAATRARGEE